MTQAAWSSQDEDEAAVERYRYLLQTADPATIEQVHREAFDRLTPAQRQIVFQQLAAAAPAGEAPGSADSAALARSATRSELRRPGLLERTFGSSTAGAAFGGSMLGGIAGVVVGSVLANGLGHLLRGPGLLGGLGGGLGGLGGGFGHGGVFGGGAPFGGFGGEGGGFGGGPGGFGGGPDGGPGGGFGGGPGGGPGF